MGQVTYTGAIQPLFRDRDVRSMARFFDLRSYDDVKSHAEAIFAQLSGGTMPCDGAWPPEHVALFRAWMDQGYAR